MTSKSRTLDAEELESLAAELDALRARTVAVLGEAGARYMRRV